MPNSRESPVGLSAARRRRRADAAGVLIGAASAVRVTWTAVKSGPWRRGGRSGPDRLSDPPDFDSKRGPEVVDDPAEAPVIAEADDTDPLARTEDEVEG